MKKTDKVISLELTKKLQKVAKEAGFKLLESEYAWIKVYEDKGEFVLRIKDHGWHCYKEYKAFDVAKLGEILPGTLLTNKQGYGLEIYKIGHIKKNKYEDGWWVLYQNSDDEDDFLHFENSEINLVDAMCKMLIYLIKNKLI